MNIPANVNDNYRWPRRKNDKTCKSYEKIDLYIRSEYVVNWISQNQWGEKLFSK